MVVVLEERGENQKAQGKVWASPCNAESAFAELAGTAGKGQFALPNCACDWVRCPLARDFTNLTYQPSWSSHITRAWCLVPATAQRLLMKGEPNSTMWPNKKSKGLKTKCFYFRTFIIESWGLPINNPRFTDSMVPCISHGVTVNLVIFLGGIYSCWENQERPDGAFPGGWQ